jgi:hypothetical protein
MLKRGIRTLAVTGTMTVAAALLALGATGASATTTTASAPAHVTASRAAHAVAALSGCVAETFTIADEPYDLQCVNDAQVLFNDLYYYEEQHPNHEDRTYLGVNQLLATDGHYGPDTTSVVEFFQGAWSLGVDGYLGQKTWYKLCYEDWQHGYTGNFWRNAGCNTESGL